MYCIFSAEVLFVHLKHGDWDTKSFEDAICNPRLVIRRFMVNEEITWYLAGISPTDSTFPFALALVLEEENLPLAEEIGQALLTEAMGR